MPIRNEVFVHSSKMLRTALGPQIESNAGWPSAAPSATATTLGNAAASHKVTN